ncbi:MAG TPA: alpha-L-arabinofuranosidase C-terminal domain-containing protein [Verrucomicrobiae bacterium]|nr:alpha-L-arabinofuranosidase C-terminal domain-containing protein [Verrucomicrobiae bacterium]
MFAALISLKRRARRAPCLAAASLFLAAACASAAPATITVSVDKPGHAISPLLWGIFFEDINLSADGGLYPELVRNRSFEDADHPENWKIIPRGGSSAAIDDTRPLNLFNPHSLRVKTDGLCSLENGGYWGMNFVAGDRYDFKVAARSADGFRGTIQVRLCDASGNAIASREIRALSADWKYHTLSLTPSKSDPKGHLQVEVVGTGTVFLDMVSLLPAKTWKDHGLRVDLAESIDALRPAFLRFPGGCWVEGEVMSRAYQWKDTVGAIDLRKPLFNIWGYHATHGLGYHEYLQLAEDLDAEPLFCINAGMSHRESVPMGRMDRWVQDALDAIEYANGPTNSVWGSLRARNGHPNPFNLRYLEIGNENGGRDYAERWPLFVHAIRQKHPEVILIANHWAGGFPTNPMPEIVDEHYNESPEAFMRRATQYDSYDRKGPKVFVGEYAVTKNAGKGHLRAALGEAAFMTGMERNSDVVAMAAYAPLFVNLNHRAWNPDLINFDSSGWYGLPGYYVQQMFALNRGDVTLPIQVQSDELERPAPRGAIGFGTWNTQAEFKDVRVASPSGDVLFTSDFSKGTNGWKFFGDGEWKIESGALRQSAEKPFVRALFGDKSWKDYTIEAKARKLGGREGFLVLFHIQDDEDRTWWNVGGWENTQHAVELDATTNPRRGSVTEGTWYDLKVEVAGPRVRCWLNGDLIHDVRRAALPTKAIYASATRDRRSGDVIVKVVNTDAGPVETTIDLQGAGALTGAAKAIVLTSASPADENSIQEPRKVSPKSEDVTLAGAKFTRSFPGNSFTVLRIATQK